MSFISNNVNNKNFELQGSVQGSNNAAKSENVDFLFDGMIKEDTKTKEELLAENDKNAKYKLDCKLRSKNYIEGLKGKTTNAQLNYEAFKKAGAKNVTGLAFAALNKSNAVVKNASVKIQSLFNKLARILTGGETDPDKIKEKEKAVEKKIEALMKEAAAKLDILSDISQSLFKIHKLTLEMGIFNMQTHEILDFMNKMITGVNEGTDDFSDIKEEDFETSEGNGEDELSKIKFEAENKKAAEALSEKNKTLETMEEENSTKFDEALNEKIYETMNNLYGPETTEKFEEEKTKLQEKIVELTEKIEKNDLDETDKFARQKAELQLQTYVFEYELLDYIINKIAEFAPQE